jgi:hypothetical protein
MVKGLEVFREHFKSFEGSFVLIGGAACHEWFAAEGLEFRSTKDLDMVLMIEVLQPDFVSTLRAFVNQGDYEIRERTEDGSPILYRFSKPRNSNFPYMLELFSRKHEQVDLGDGQEIVPIPVGNDIHSLSAILLDENYYSLIRSQHDLRDGLAVANPTALILLKAHAWLDLTKRKEAGEKIDSKDIDKHRNDVFRLAGTLPGTPGPELQSSILVDLKAFLEQHTEDSPAWLSILSSIQNTLGRGVKPSDLRSTLQTYFRIN